MSFVHLAPELITAAATDLANLGSTISEANTAAAALTTELVPAAQDEISAAIAGLFGRFAQEYQSLNAQAEVFHDRFVQAMTAGVEAYSATETGNAATLLQAAATTVPAITQVMGGSGMPLPPASFIDAVNSLYIQPNLPGTTSVPLFTPEQFYPFSVTEMSLSASVATGLRLLDNSLQPYIATGTPVGVFGYSQSAIIASLEMEALRAAGVPSSAVHFVLIGNPMNPNGGLFERFAGLQLTSLGINFYGATPSDAYPTTIYTVEYDGWADFPRYPLNFLADLNAFQSQTHFSYTNLTPEQISSAIQLPTTGASQTTYYMIPTTNLPLLDSTRAIPIIGNPIADLLQPNLRYLVNMGYGDPLYGWSTSPADVPTPAGLFPPLSAFQQLPALLVSGTEQGIHDFIGDLTGTGPNPVVWPSLGSLTGAVDPSGGALGATGAATGQATAFSALLANPAALAAAPTDVATGLWSASSTLYTNILRPTADIISGAVISVPLYDVQLFQAGIGQALNGQPVVGLINAVGMPLAANVALYGMLWNFEVAVLEQALP